MQINIKTYNPDNLEDNAIVVFPAKVAFPIAENGRTRFRYVNKLSLAGSVLKILSASFDKATNRAQLYIEATRIMSLEVAGVHEEQYKQADDGVYAPTRSSLDIKLDVPRGTFSCTRTSILDIVSVAKGEVKLRAADGSEVTTKAATKCANVVNHVRQFLEKYYTENGCPEQVDRRKMPPAIKSYTGDLREPWRVEQHEFAYPANGLASTIVDHLLGGRLPQLTMAKLIEMHLIPGYPQIQMKCAASVPASSVRQVSFAGIYQRGGRAYTKNLQLAVKLSRLLGTQVTAKDLDAAFDTYYRNVTRLQSMDNRPYIMNTADGSYIFFVGVTKLT